MGRQIRFFMLGQDEEEFLKHVKENGDIIIDTKGNVLETEYILETSMPKVLQVLIKSPQSKIVLDLNGFVNDFKSDVIVFSRSTSLAKHDPKRIWDGRLWVELRNYDENGIVVMKPKWLEENFNRYKKWITKNCKISNDKAFYICRNAYRLNKDEGYKMMNSPKYEVEFE